MNMNRAINLITCHMLPALINNITIVSVMVLYPQQGVQVLCMDVTHQAEDMESNFYNYSDHTLLPLFKRIKTSKASRQYVDITDTIHDVAVEETLIKVTSKLQTA
eukprot:8532145-Ditylum_brightwellii.AAC.1